MHTQDQATPQLAADTATGIEDMHDLVVDLALGALITEFGGRGAAAIRPGLEGRLTVLQSRMPDGWGDFWRVAGAVRDLLNSTDRERQVQAGDQWLALHRVAAKSGPVAAVVILDAPMPEDQFRSAARLVRSVLATGAEENPVAEASIVVDVQHHDGGFEASVRRAGYLNNRPVKTRGSKPAEAIALAATRLCDQSVKLRFAAQRTVIGEDGRANSVSVVVVEAEDGGPIFGVVASPAGSMLGPAEAVIKAAAMVDQDQLISV